MALSPGQWRKSSRSGMETNCVEITYTTGHILTRDSKTPTGPTLSYHPTQWTAFLDNLKNSNLNLP